MLTEDPDERHYSCREVLKSLFHLLLSGTLATAEDRLVIIEELLDSEEEKSQQLGIALLKEALQAWHFGSVYGFDFGARPRSDGYRPRSRAEVEHWFGTFIRKCVQVAVSNRPTAPAARAALADQFRGLWTKGGMHAELEGAARAIRAAHPWFEGWLSVRETLGFDKKDLDPAAVDALRRLEEFLRPTSLLERARTYALSDSRSFGLDDLDDEEPGAAGERAEEIARQIGEEVARDHEALAILLPEIVSSTGHRLGSFGEGLEKNATDRRAVWNSLRQHFEAVEEEKRRASVFLGFLVGVSREDRSLCESVLDEIVSDPLLCRCFPLFQNAIGIDEHGLKRLHKALDTGATPVNVFSHIVVGARSPGLEDDHLADLLDKIMLKEGGIDTAIDIVEMRMHYARREGLTCSEKLLQCGRRLFTLIEFSSKRRNGRDQDYALGYIAKFCLKGEAAHEAATVICQRLRDADRQHQAYMFDFPEVLRTLAKYHPVVFLDTFLTEDNGKGRWRRRVFEDHDLGRNPLSAIPDNTILKWCENDPNSRYTRVLAEIPLFFHPDKTGELQSDEAKKPLWRPVVLAIIQKTPDLASAFNTLHDALVPTSWSGSRADAIQRRLPLLMRLFNHENSEVAAWARSTHTAMQDRVRRERESEDAESRERDERFE